MSGAAIYLQEFFRDTDVIAVMTETNAAYELNHALKTGWQLVSDSYTHYLVYVVSSLTWLPVFT